MEFEIYQDAAGEWRWRLQAANNRIIANSGDGYKNKNDCIDIVVTIQRDVAGATMKVIE